MHPAHLIAIVGGSGSGKTWLARTLDQAFHGHAGHVSLDDFYHDLSHLPAPERATVNFDDPAAIEWPLFRQSLAGIRSGQAVPLPEYDLTTHTRRPTCRAWQPRRLALLEGLWLLHEPDLRDLYSLSIFVHCPEPVRLARRLERDQRERGRSAASVLESFHNHVSPMHQRYVAPQERHADLVVQPGTGTASVAELIAVLGRLLHSHTAPR